MIITNGCSFTWVDELSDRADAWPFVLGRRLGVDVVNLAVCGGSNRRAVRTTVEAVPRLVRSHGFAPHEVLVLIMWASLERYEFFDEEPDPIGRSEWLPGDENWRRVLPWASRRKDRLAHTYYSRIHDDHGARVTFLVDWVLVQEFLAHQGYRHGFLAARPLTEDPSALPAHLTAMLDKPKILGGLAGLNSHAMLTLTDGRYPYGPRRHPLAGAHERFAVESVLPWSRQLS
jgi:hypothetical protein